MPLSYENQNLGVYDDGDNLSGRCSADVTGKRFLKITGARTSGNIAVAQCAAGDRSCGVSAYDALSGDVVGVMRGNARVVFVTAGAALTAFQEVQAGANGVAIVAAAGAKLGYVLTDCANGADAEVSLY